MQIPAYLKKSNTGLPRFGLCCIFKEQKIKFGTTNVLHTAKLPRDQQLLKLSKLCLQNAEALLSAIEWCSQNNIGAFRINSQILPLKTHPQLGYQFRELPDSEAVIAKFMECGQSAKKKKFRLSFHPDQFVVLNSPSEKVVSASIAEIEYQAELAEMVGADVINVHGGGVYGDKKTALRRFCENFQLLSGRAKERLTLENDDKCYHPQDLLPICHELGIPLVYDVHHHRCLRDSLDEQQATAAAAETWSREPLFHVSSPLNGWQGNAPNKHHDYIDAADFPEIWLKMKVTVEVEAKAKELAIRRLMSDLML